MSLLTDVVCITILHCIYHHHCDTDVMVNNDNICCIVYNSDTYHIEDSVLVLCNFYNVQLVI